MQPTSFTISLSTNFNRSTAVIKHLGEIHLGNSFEGFAEEALMRAQVLQSALENSATILAATRAEVLQLCQDNEEDNDEFTLFERNSDSTLSLLRTAKVIAGKLFHTLRDMKSRSLSLDSETAPQFDKCSGAAAKLSDYFSILGEAMMKLVGEEHSQTQSFTHILTVLRQASADYLNAESAQDLFYQPQKQLSSLINTLNELTNMAADFNNLTEFEKPQPPWITRSKELQNRKAISAVAEEEIKNLKRDAQDRATALKLRQEQLEEASMKIELLEKRAKDAAIKLGRISELEVLVKQGKERESGLEKAVEAQVRAAQKVEEERDGWIRKASEVKTVLKPGEGVVRTGAEMIGSSVEMEEMREEIKVLHSMNRYLRQQVRQTLADQDTMQNSWLSVPLRAPVRRGDLGTDIREALENIASLPFSSKLVRVRGKEKTGIGAKQTAKYQLIEQEIKRLKAFDSIESYWRGEPVIAGVDVLPEPLT
jgi:dynactin 1